MWVRVGTHDIKRGVSPNGPRPSIRRSPLATRIEWSAGDGEELFPKCFKAPARPRTRIDDALMCERRAERVKPKRVRRQGINAWVECPTDLYTNLTQKVESTVKKLTMVAESDSSGDSDDVSSDEAHVELREGTRVAHDLPESSGVAPSVGDSVGDGPLPAASSGDRPLPAASSGDRPLSGGHEPLVVPAPPPLPPASARAAPRRRGDWVRVPVEGGELFWSQAAGSLDAHCASHRGCKCDRSMTYKQPGKGRPVGKQLLWLKLGARLTAAAFGVIKNQLATSNGERPA